jgi:pimeloyl-ACP methyl ester carboxylesterase
MAECERGDGGFLSYESWGDPEAPPVLLIHDLLADHRAWLPCILPLAEEYRVLAPDLPGHGQSSPLGDNSPASVEQLATEVGALLRAEEVGLCAIAGTGVGALIALHLALESPDSAAAVVLADLPDATPEPAGLSFPATSAAATMLRFGVAELGKRAAATMHDPFLAAGMRARYGKTDAESYAAMSETARVFAGERPPIQGRLAMPVLFMAPDTGPLRTVAEAAAGEVEQARVALFRDAEAGVLISRPDAIGDVIVRFFHDIEDGKPLAAHLVR